jgi:pyruvate dehydrogenase E2 component (dihydrolipoamide acetyltransferase)
MCVIGNEGESFAEFDPKNASGEATPASKTGEAAPAETEKAAEAAEIAEPVQFIGEMKISPRAKTLAERRGADLSKVVPTGPDGRVIARDVQALIDQGLVVSPAARAAYQGGLTGTGIGGRVVLADLEKKTEEKKPEAQKSAEAAKPVEAAKPQESDTYEEPLTNIRKVIAKAMSNSLSSMAQLTHNISFDCTEIQSLRKMFKEKGEAMGMSKVTLNDIIMFAVVKTLTQPEHKALNANLLDGKTMKYYRCVNLGMAVDTERGLMVPTIFHAEKMSLKELSDSAKALAKEAQSGKIDPDKLKDASFTVSNLGSLGIESFTPVINPPQTGILGVNTITTGVKDVNGTAVPYPRMTLSLTYDHRALDGTPASKFLRDLKNNLENFTLLLAKG